VPDPILEQILRDEAEVVRLAEKYAVPVDLVDRNLDRFQQLELEDAWSREKPASADVLFGTEK
jgi:hypothetical protein